MMTRTGKVMFVLHGMVLIGCTRAGAIAYSHTDWHLGTTLYVVAGICLAAICREISRAELHESGRRMPYWVCWLKGRWMFGPPCICCDRYVSSFGVHHDDLCHQSSRSYLAEAGDEE